MCGNYEKFRASVCLLSILCLGIFDFVKNNDSDAGLFFGDRRKLFGLSFWRVNNFLFLFFLKNG